MVDVGWFVFFLMMFLVSIVIYYATGGDSED
jgi:hypothetical protein